MMEATLKKEIQNALPSLGASDVEKVCNQLLDEAGVERQGDLKFIEEKDLLGVLKPIQIRRLLSSWKQAESSFFQEDMPAPQLMSSPALFSTPVRPILRDEMASSSSSVASSSEESTSVTASSSRSTTSGTRSTTYAFETFTPQLDTLPSSLKTCLKNRKTPDPKARKNFVRIVVEAMQKIKVNPDLKECTIVARKIVELYPKSFQDVTDEGERLGTGYGGLLRQIKNRVENVNRNNSYVRLRQAKKRASDSGTPKVTSTAKDSYGCINWQPDELPDNETEDSLEEKRRELVSIFERNGLSQAGSSQVESLMMVTYYLQRKAINSNDEVEKLTEDWPFLFSPRWIFGHFKTLTGINPMECFPLSLDQKGPNIKKFFQQNRCNKNVQAILCDQEEDGNEGAEIIRLLMAHFGESEDNLFKLVDVTKSAVEVEEEGLPSSPKLILQGRTMATSSKWMISAEGKVIIVSTTSSVSAFVKGLAALFCVFYIFNLEYQVEAAVTLEFIQRCFFKINPDRGTKCTSKKRKSKKKGREVMRKREDVNPKVMSLMNDLAQFLSPFAM